MLITGGMMQKILTKQMMMIFLLIRTLTGTHKHIIYLDMKYGNRVLNKGQTRSPSLTNICQIFSNRQIDGNWTNICQIVTDRQIEIGLILAK